MTINTEKFLEDARKLTEQRMAAAEKIAEAISTRVAAEEALKKAEAEERKAYREAERHGWTKTELNKLKPTKKRRSPQKKNTPQSSQNTSNSTPETTTQGSVQEPATTRD
jgi:ABC-type oligopeptide transport system ATPase subunit